MGCLFSSCKARKKRKEDAARALILSESKYQDPETPFLRILLVGATGVGKTSIFNRIMTGTFEPTTHTVRANLGTKRMRVGREYATVQFYDLPSLGVAGLKEIYLESGVDACILVYSASDSRSREQISMKWVPSLHASISRMMCLPEYQPKTAEEEEAEALADIDDDDDDLDISVDDMDLHLTKMNEKNSDKLPLPLPAILLRNMADTTLVKGTEQLTETVRKHKFFKGFSVSAKTDDGIHSAVKELLKEVVRLYPLAVAERNARKLRNANPNAAHGKQAERPLELDRKRVALPHLDKPAAVPEDKPDWEVDDDDEEKFERVTVGQ